MRSAKIILCIVSVLCVCAQARRESSPASQQTRRIVIAASTLLDGRALDGDPLKDITAVRRVVFVMKGGIVYKNSGRGAFFG